MKLYELFEQVKWAIGPNIDQASIRGKHDQNNPEFTMLMVDITDLFSKADPDQHIDLSTQEGQIKGRIGRAKEHWEGGGYMDPSVAAYNPNRDHFSFTDGRHRLVTAYQLGERWAPILFPTYQIETVKGILKTK